MGDLIWSFAPWVVYWLAARATSYGEAIAWALGAAVIVVVRALIRRHVHLLDVASGVYFVALGVVAVVTDPGDLGSLPKYTQAGSHAALTVIVFLTILIGRPFTESYARESTPKQYWSTPEFHQTNRVISAVWGLAFLLGTVSLIIAGAVDNHQVLWRFIIPIGALYAAFEFTQRRRAQAEHLQA